MTKPKLPTACMRVSLAFLLTLAAISAGVLGSGGKSALAAPLGVVPAPSVMVPAGGTAYLDVRGFALQPGGSIAADALRPGLEPIGPAQLRTTLYYGINWGYADSEPQQVALALWYAQGGTWLDANHVTAERIASAAAASQSTPSWLPDGRSLLQLLASGNVTVADLTLSPSALSAAMGTGTLAVHNAGTQDVLVHLPYGTTFTGASGSVLVWATGAGTAPPAATPVATAEPIENTPVPAAATDTPVPPTPVPGNSKGDFTPAPRATAPGGKSGKASPTTAASATPVPTETPLPTDTPLPQPTDTPTPEPTATVAPPTAVAEPPANPIPDGGSKKNAQPPATDSNTGTGPANGQEPSNEKEPSGSAAPVQAATEPKVEGQAAPKDVAMGPLPVTPAATPTRPRPTQPAAPAPNGTSVSSDQIPPPNGTSVSGQVPPPVTTAVGGPGSVVPQPQETAFLPVPTTEPTSAPETKPTEQPTAAGPGSEEIPGGEEKPTSPPVVETKEPQATPVPQPSGSDEAAGGAPGAPPVINVEPQDPLKVPEPAPPSELPVASNQGSPPDSTPATGGGQSPLAWWLSFSSLVMVLGGWALRRAGSAGSVPVANTEER
ncbi:MAG TPA: hypothetical protein VGE45_11960 [Chloroflexia bacterium]